MSGQTKVNEPEVRSSDGFSIKYGRESMTYVERDLYGLSIRAFSSAGGERGLLARIAVHRGHAR